jgi:uncharacterized membrane protein YphA (DoxX/SURF4 family)
MNDERHHRRLDWAFLYARVTLGIAFLSGIADRFGLWRSKNVGYGNFEGFIRYTAKVNSFMPASSIPFLAWSATIAKLALGIFLLIGVWRRWTALASALLLILFGTAMAISFGAKSPLDYSVFSASAAAICLLSMSAARPGRTLKDWDPIDRYVYPLNRKSEGKSSGIPHLAKNERDIWHPSFVRETERVEEICIADS